MNKKLVSTFSFLVLLVICSICSQTLASNVASNLPRVIALGGTSTALSGVVGTYNPASIISETNQCSVYYNNLHAMPGFEIKGINLGVKLLKGTLALVYDDEGVSLLEDRMGENRRNFWGDKQFGVSYGFEFKDNIRFGFALWQHIQQVSFDGIEKANRKQLFDFGMLFDNERWCLGLTARSILAGKEKNHSPELAVGLRLGEAKKLAVYLETTIKENEVWEKQTFFNAGVEVWIRPNLALRLGLDSAGAVTTGLGLKKGKMSIDYTYYVHSLGNTHYLGTSFYF